MSKDSNCHLAIQLAEMNFQVVRLLKGYTTAMYTSPTRTRMNLENTPDGNDRFSNVKQFLIARIKRLEENTFILKTLLKGKYSETKTKSF